MNEARRRAIHDAMVRLSDGDRGACGELLDELWPALLSFAERGVGRGPDAEDVAQEVFYRICSRITDFDPSRDGLSWAFGIAGYEILTHRRRASRRREVRGAPLSDLPLEGVSAEGAMIEREMALALDRAVGALTEEERRLLGVAPGRASTGPASPAERKRRQRALERLRELWRSLYGEP